MEGGLRGTLVLLVIMQPLLALTYAVATTTTTNVGYVVTTATLTLMGHRTVTMVVPLGYYTYVYTYTEPFGTTFTLFCSGTATLGFLTPTVLATANIIETIISSVTTLTTKSVIEMSLSSPFYYLLGSTESESYALVDSESLSTITYGNVSASGRYALVGKALVVPAGELRCYASPPLSLTVALIDGKKATLYGNETTISTPVIVLASYGPLGTITMTFPTEAFVEGTVYQYAYTFIFKAEKPEVRTPFLALAGIGLATALRRLRRLRGSK